MHQKEDPLPPPPQGNFSWLPTPNVDEQPHATQSFRSSNPDTPTISPLPPPKSQPLSPPPNHRRHWLAPLSPSSVPRLRCAPPTESKGASPQNWLFPSSEWRNRLLHDMKAPKNKTRKPKRPLKHKAQHPIGVLLGKKSTERSTTKAVGKTYYRIHRNAPKGPARKRRNATMELHHRGKSLARGLEVGHGYGGETRHIQHWIFRRQACVRLRRAHIELVKR